MCHISMHKNKPDQKFRHAIEKVMGHFMTQLNKGCFRVWQPKTKLTSFEEVRGRRKERKREKLMLTEYQCPYVLCLIQLPCYEYLLFTDDEIGEWLSIFLRSRSQNLNAELIPESRLFFEYSTLHLMNQVGKTRQTSQWKIRENNTLSRAGQEGSLRRGLSLLERYRWTLLLLDSAWLTFNNQAMIQVAVANENLLCTHPMLGIY